jgi:hypothetical protein
MQFKRIWLMVGLCAMIGMSTMAISSPTEDVPETKPVYAAKAPVIDGKLDDAAWGKATELTLLHYTQRTPLKEPTKVKLLYDRNNLYVGFICKESQMKKTLSLVTALNGPVFTDDCVEIMLAPNQTASDNRYIHFAANMLGTRYTNKYGIVADLPWKVKTSRQKDGWTAEFAIPFKSVVEPETNAACWRVNFYREEQPRTEYSSWAPTQGSFHTPALFGILSGLLFDGKFLGMTAPVIPLKGDTTGPDVFRLETATAPKEMPSIIIPKPVRFDLNGKKFPIDKNTRIIIADNPTPGILQAASEINQELKELYGIELAILSESHAGSFDNHKDILLGTTGQVKQLETRLKSLNLEVTPATPGPEGYILQADENQVLICGSDDAGSYYGVQSFKQLLRSKDDSSIYAIGSKIWDKPAFKIRSALISIDKDSPVAHRKMIEKIFARYKINHLIAETEAGIAYKSCPEVWVRPMAKPEDVKELVRFAKAHFMKVTPLLQTLGHSEWVFRYDKHLDICEDTSIPYAYCPENPNTYKFIFPIIDETLDIFDNPEYFHIGHDEVDMLGHFPAHDECKKLGKPELVYRDTMTLYHYLKQKKVKTMMWGDILLKPYFAEHIDKLPKDILICDWHYDPATTQRSVDFFQDKGFQVLGCGWYDPVNIEGFARYCDDKKSLGMMVTIWAGFYGSNNVVVDNNYQIAAYILSADYWWNPSDRPWFKQDYYASEVLDRVWYGKEAVKPKMAGFAVNLAPYANLYLEDKGNASGFLNAGKGEDLSGLTAEAVDGKVHLWDDVVYQFSKVNAKPAGILLKGRGLTSSFPSRVDNIKINRYADQLNFLHTCLYSAPTGTVIGKYVINYIGGYSAEIPLVYGVNISGWQDWNTYFGGKLAWQGKTAKGKPIYFREMSYNNPKLHKRIVSVDFVCTHPEVSPLLLGITGSVYRE